jgi:hypothetical protein
MCLWDGIMDALHLSSKMDIVKINTLEKLYGANHIVFSSEDELRKTFKDYTESSIEAMMRYVNDELTCTDKLHNWNLAQMYYTAEKEDIHYFSRSCYEFDSDENPHMLDHISAFINENNMDISKVKGVTRKQLKAQTPTKSIDESKIIVLYDTLKMGKIKQRGVIRHESKSL